MLLVSTELVCYSGQEWKQSVQCGVAQPMTWLGVADLLKLTSLTKQRTPSLFGISRTDKETFLHRRIEDLSCALIHRMFSCVYGRWHCN